MGRIILITGGCRSGKSDYAQKIAESMPGPRAFIATCPVIDTDMEMRIKRHQEARRDRGWQTIEEPLKLGNAIRDVHAFHVVVVDCLTLWINNLLYEAGRAEKSISESDVAQHCLEVISACHLHPGTIVFVTNEVGMGIIPGNSLARHYRDLAGRCNQTIAAASHRMVLLISGQPLELKEKDYL